MKKLLLLLALLLPAPAWATTWYVSSAIGSDANNCTQAQTISTPKLTIAAGLACVGAAGTEDGAGDTVQVAAGSYPDSGNGNLVDVIPSGTSGNEFTLKCVTDFACEIAVSSGNNSLGFNTAAHYITIRGFVWTGGGGGYFSSNTDNTFHHVSFINNEYKDAPLCFSLISGSGAADILIKGNLIHNVGSDPVCIGFCHGIYASSHTQRWTIEDNRIYDTHGYAIHVYSEDPVEANRPDDFIIRRNITYDNGDVGVNGSGIITYGFGHQIYNNITYANATFGIMIRSTETLVYNNTLYNNPDGGIYHEGLSLVSCVNNLIIGNGGSPIGGPGAPCGTQTNNVTTGTAASHFVDAGAADFHLVAGSGALDAGVAVAEVTTDFDGDARADPPDVGADEFGGSPPACSITIQSPTAGSIKLRPATTSIGWTPTNCSGNVTIQASFNGGTTWNAAFATVAFDSSPYVWDTVIGRGTNVKIRVCSGADCGTSEAFTVQGEFVK